VLKADNPGLIYCAISGFGRTGPYADRGGFDLIAQGMRADGDHRRGPGPAAGQGRRAGHRHHRRHHRPPWACSPPTPTSQKTGEGQLVDTSLFEAGISLTYWQSAICLATGISPGPMGSAHPLNAPYQAFEHRPTAGSTSALPTRTRLRRRGTGSARPDKFQTRRPK
jgi:hypothetical protein